VSLALLRVLDDQRGTGDERGVERSAPPALGRAT
jgi:hypothetical protein